MIYDQYIHSSIRGYGTSPNFVARIRLRDLSGYSSLYAVDEATAKAITASGTTAGYKGIVWSERLWIDVDDYQKADETEEVLIKLGVDYVAYDSGGRGAHFGVLRDARPSHLLPSQDKQWVRDTLPHADLSVYTHLHLFRLPNTVHERTGRLKELVRAVKGSVLQLSPLRKAEVERVQMVIDSVRSGGTSYSIFSNFRVLECSAQVENGERHPQLVRCAYALKEAGAASHFALSWLRELNKSFKEPKAEWEVDNILKRVYG